MEITSNYSTPTSHHHLINNGSLSNYNKISVLNINSNGKTSMQNHQQLKQDAQDLSKLKSTKTNSTSNSMLISNHSGSSSISSASSSSSSSSSNSSTPSSLLSGSLNYGINSIINSSNEHELDTGNKSDTKLITINTKNYNLNRITAVKNINNSINDKNINNSLTSSMHDNMTKVRVTNNGVNYVKTQQNNRNTNIYSNYHNKSKIIVGSCANEEKQLKESGKSFNSPIKNNKEFTLSPSDAKINNTVNKSSKNNEVNYTNLQLALKAATAALEKSKITASTVYSNSNKADSNVNVSKTGNNNNNSLSQSQSSLTNVPSLQKEFTKPSTSTNNLNSTSARSQASVLTNSDNGYNMSAKSTSLISNQSLFQPYAKQFKNVQGSKPLHASSAKLILDLSSNDVSPKSNQSSGLNSDSTGLLGSTSTAFTKIAPSSLNPVILKKNQNSNSLNIKGTANGCSGSITSLNNNIIDNNNNNPNPNKRISVSSDKNKIFRHTISLVVDNSNPTFINNSSIKNADHSKSNNSTVSSTNKNNHFTNTTIPTNIDSSGYDNIEEIDNINISVSLQNGNTNTAVNLNKNPLLYGSEAPLNCSGTSSGVSNNRKSSDYENDSINCENNNNNISKNSVINSILKAAISSSNLNSHNLNSKNGNTSNKNSNYYYPNNLNGNTSPTTFANCTKIVNKLLNEPKPIDNNHNKEINLKQQNALKRQKSASTEYLNLSKNGSNYEIVTIGQNSMNTNINDYSSILCDDSQNYENISQEKSKEFHSPPRLSPQPPQIQQFSGVLSKSLFSVVLKPQPLKPTIDSTNRNSTTLSQLQLNQEKSSQISLHGLNQNLNSIISTSSASSTSSYNQSANNIKPSKNVLRNSTNNKLLLKKKCVSTTNLKYDSSIVNSSLVFNNIDNNKSSSNINKSTENICPNKVSSKSVSFLNNLEQCDDISNKDNKVELSINSEKEEQISNSDNSINNLDHDRENNLKSISAYSNMESSINQGEKENKKRINDLINVLESKSKEIDDLQVKLKNEIEMHQICRNQRSSDLVEQLEEEKQIYEQKLNSIRSNFNQQLKLFEQNERNSMQDKLNSLQAVYNELKLNYKKNLEKELKSLRLKLNESQTYAAQLVKQIQMQTQSKPKTFCLASTQTLSLSTIDTISLNDLNTLAQENPCSKNSSELIFFMKKLKSENNELKFQLDTERKLFQKEKEKWQITNIDCQKKTLNQHHQSSNSIDNQQYQSNRNLTSLNNFSNEIINKITSSSLQFQNIKNKDNLLHLNGSISNLNGSKQQQQPLQNNQF